MSKYVLLSLLIGCLFSTTAWSQSPVRGTATGIVIDSTDGKPLSNATVSVTPLGGDSTQATFTVSDKKGAFTISRIPAGQYRLLITYEGYLHITRTFSISDSSSVVTFSGLNMSRDDMLQEVVIQRPPMGIKKDTVEYNASMFAVKPNAVAEDLIKKMPGITVDNSGTITAHGEQVTRVLVDGKRFFSNDPKLATRNLPPDVIDKIQVFDDLSDQSKFTGFDDGNRVKTINIVTKKNARKGWFGKFIGADGTNEDYDESVNLHHFDGNSQMSLLGQANDINKQNFTPGDILGSGGSGGRRGGGGGGGGAPSAATSQQGSGITTVWAGGGNYHNTWGKTDFSGSYFYNDQHIMQKVVDSNLTPIKSLDGTVDSSNVTSGNSYNISRISSHQIAFNLETSFDSSNSLIFRPNITFQKNTPSGTSFSQTYDNSFAPVNSSYNKTASVNSGYSINGSNLTLRHKFKKPWRTISLDMNVTGNVNNGNGNNYAINNFYKLGYVDTLNQYYNDSLHSWTFTPTLSYTEPIAKNQVLQLNYSHTYTKSTTINNTYDFVDSLKGFDHFDSLFSNSYKFTQNSDNVSLAWRLQAQKLNLSVGSGIQWTSFTSNNTTKDLTVAHNYINYTPTVNLNYTFSSTSHLRMNYTGRTGTPTAAQLQPLTTTTDEISYQVGNPGLKPQFTHSLRVLYANFDPGSQRVIFATLNASTIVNDIQSAVYRNEKGGQTSTFVNLGGTYNINGFFNYGFPLKSPKSNLNLITNFKYTQSQSLLATDSLAAAAGNYLHEYTKVTNISERINWTTNIKKNFDMNFASTTGYTINRNPSSGGSSSSDSSKSGKASSSSNLNSFTETLSAEFTAYTNNGWLIAASFDYTYTYNHSNQFNASIPLLTPSIAKQLFKKKNGELRLTVFDVLDKNKSVAKSVGNYGAVSYTQTNTLSRYAMLTFTYNLNNFQGQQRRGPGGMFPGGGRFRGGGGSGGPGGGGGFRGPDGLYALY